MNSLIVANITSFIPFLFFVIEFINILYKFFKNYNIKTSIKYFYGLILSTSLAQCLKYLIPYPNWFHKYSMRPEGASNCDYLSCGGLVKENTPGFPSGHMTTTAYFVIYNILYIIKNKINKLLIIPNIFLLVLMGWARIYKLCHNLVQVISGTILGTLIGIIFFYKINKIDL
jgi:membrane-associated phospholipid phosphatase